MSKIEFVDRSSNSGDSRDEPIPEVLPSRCGPSGEDPSPLDDDGFARQAAVLVGALARHCNNPQEAVRLLAITSWTLAASIGLPVEEMLRVFVIETATLDKSARDAGVDLRSTFEGKAKKLDG